MHEWCNDLIKWLSIISSSLLFISFFQNFFFNFLFLTFLRKTSFILQNVILDLMSHGNISPKWKYVLI